jgi:hypothetical protein
MGGGRCGQRQASLVATGLATGGLRGGHRSAPTPPCWRPTLASTPAAPSCGRSGRAAATSAETAVCPAATLFPDLTLASAAEGGGGFDRFLPHLPLLAPPPAPLAEARKRPFLDPARRQVRRLASAQSLSWSALSPPFAGGETAPLTPPIGRPAHTWGRGERPDWGAALFLSRWGGGAGAGKRP